MTDALFRVDEDSGDQGFDAVNGQVLTFTLKTLPLSGVRTWELQAYDADSFVPTSRIDRNPPRQSTGAPELVLVGATSGQRVSPAAGPSGQITCELPASGSHSWILRSIINGGQRLMPGGQTVDDASLIHERLIAIRDDNGARKIVPTETTQYSDDGWTDAVNAVLGVPGSLALGGGILQIGTSDEPQAAAVLHDLSLGSAPVTFVDVFPVPGATVTLTGIEPQRQSQLIVVRCRSADADCGVAISTEDVNSAWRFGTIIDAADGSGAAASPFIPGGCCAAFLGPAVLDDAERWSLLWLGGGVFRSIG